MPQRSFIGWVLTAILAPAAATVSAQDDGPNLAPKTKTPSKPVAAANILVTCDLACNWNLDGEAKGRIDAGNSVKAKVELGQHLVVATTENGPDKVEKEIDIERTTQTIVRLELQPVRDARLKAQPTQPSGVAASPPPTKPSKSAALRLQRTLLGLSLEYSIAFSPDGQTVASSTSNRKVQIWDVPTGQLLRSIEGFTSPVFSLAFNRDGRMLATSGGNDPIKLWDVSSGQLLRTLEEQTNFIALSPDGHTLASSGRDKIKLWDLASGQVIWSSEPLQGAYAPIVFSRDGRTLAARTHPNSDGWRIWLLDVASGRLLRTLDDQFECCWILTFSPDDRILAAADADTIRLWDVSSGELLRSLKGHADGCNVTSVAFSPDGRILASGSNDETIRLWDATSWQLLATVEAHAPVVNSVAFSPNGRILGSAGNDLTVKLWELYDGSR